MIVRDEAESLGACLASVIRYVDEVIVVDTGSRDKTPDCAESFGANVHHFVWTESFSAARNYGLEKATGEWVLCLDADERLQDGDGPRLRQLLAEPTAEGFFF